MLTHLFWHVCHSLKIKIVIFHNKIMHLGRENIHQIYITWPKNPNISNMFWRKRLRFHLSFEKCICIFKWTKAYVSIYLLCSVNLRWTPSYALAVFSKSARFRPFKNAYIFPKPKRKGTRFLQSVFGLFGKS